MRKVLLAISVFVCLSLVLSAQEAGNQILEKYHFYKQHNPSEFSYLNTDKKIYFSGGKIKFCAALLNQYLTISQLSGIIYLELIHEQNKYRKKYVFRIKNGVLNDQIILPMDVPTGNFQLVAYTHLMRNSTWEDATHRKSIYIQNTLEPTKRVARAVLPAEDDYNYVTERVSIAIGETTSKLLLEINSPFDQPVDAFFVSEGYGSIQLTGKIKMKPGKTDVAINKDLLKGNFQKIILLDQELNVITARAYYLRGFGGRMRYSQSNDSTPLDEKASLLGQIESTGKLSADSLNLFRRIYKLYYKIPPEVTIDHLSFDELTSTTTLRSYSDYLRKEWTQIIQNDASEEGFSYVPEKNIHLRGSLMGDLDKLEEAHLAVHFFNEDLDMIAPLNSSGSFDIEIPYHIGNNAFIASVVNEKEGDISDQYSIAFETDAPMRYISSQVDYHPVGLTDSLFTNQMELNYILSTFNEIEDSNSYLREIREIEKKVPLDNYRNITSFEEFIREAVIDVTVVKKNGNKSINIYNSIKRTFNEPQMIILNDMALEESSLLFDIPIEKIESVNVIIGRSALSEVGSTFTGGILRVVTNQPIPVSARDLDDNFGSIAGLYYAPEENEVAHRFNPSNLLHLATDQKIKPLSDQIDEAIHLEPGIELILSDGTYQFIYDLIK